MMHESPWLHSRLAAGAAALLAGAALVGSVPAAPVPSAWASEPIVSTVAPQAGTVVVAVHGTFDPTGAQSLLETLNTARSAQTTADGASLPALTWSSDLAAVAQQRAAECSLLYDATTPSGQAAPASEERARGGASDGLGTIIGSWTTADSSAYKRITDPSTTAVGIAAFTANGTTYVVAEFGSTGGSSASPLQGEQTVSVAVSTSSIAVGISGPDLSGLEPGATAQLSYSVNYAGAPVQLAAAPTWASSDSSVATVTAEGAVVAVAPGQADLTLSSNGLVLAGTSVAVVAPTPLSATVTPEEVSTPYAVAPELPITASVTFSNGAVEDVPIEWSTIDAAAYQTGNNTFEATGTADALPVSVDVYVGAPAITGIAPLDPITITRGETPELPTTVVATLEDGTTKELPVTWDLPTGDAPMPWDTDAATVELTGTVEGVEQPVTLSIELKDPETSADTTPSDKPAQPGDEGDAPATDENPSADPDPSDTNDANDGQEPAPDDTTDDASDNQDGEKPGDGDEQNPDGDTTKPTDGEDPSNPDADSDPDSDENGDSPSDAPVVPLVKSFENPPVFYAMDGKDYTLPAEIAAVLPDGSEGTVAVDWKLPEDAKPTAEGTLVATAEVQVASDDGSDPTTEQVEQTIQFITVAQKALDLTVQQGETPALPKTVSMSYNETTVEVPVVWNTIPEDATAKTGSFTVEGTVNGTVGTVTATVTVEAEAPAIVGVTNPEPVSTTVGTAPTLPTVVTVTYDNDTTGEAEVTWAEIPAERYAAPGSFIVEGTLANTDLTASIKVTVTEAALKVKEIENPTVETPVGTAPELPQTVTVTWDDDTTTAEKVTWAAVNADQYAKPGSFTVTGTIEAADDAKVTCTVTVVNEPVSVEALADVATEAGVAPVLPSTVTVTYADGTAKKLAVTWGAIDPSSYHNEGSFTVEGSVADTNLKAQVRVLVSAPKVAAIQNNLAVQTNVGVAPQLPATASVRWSNGDTTNEPVSWTQPAASQYAKAGTFTVSGTVAGYTVACTVTVVQPAPQVVATGDTTNMVPIVVGAVAGVAIVAAAIALIVRSRKK